jgi:hypothetical protein
VTIVQDNDDEDRRCRPPDTSCNDPQTDCSTHRIISMTITALLLAALVLLFAIAVVAWAWRTMLSDEAELDVAAGLKPIDFHIGTWPAAVAGDRS